jgi:plasmid stabilization system protein ParE
MRVRFTPEAEQQTDDIDTWWRQHRVDARDPFARELANMKALLVNMPRFGTVYTILDGQPVRKALMPKTRHHVYYTANVGEGLIIIHAVWGAPKEEGPKL